MDARPAQADRVRRMKPPRRHKVDRADSIVARAIGGLPTVGMVGRANAGKSTLFNRIVGKSRAITSATPGTTRDLNIGRASYDGREFAVIDSGGLELGGGTRLSDRILEEALTAIGAADIVVFLFDGRAGLSEADKEALALVRETGCQLVVVVNKIDSIEQESRASDFYAVGVDDLILISAAHGRGVDGLLETIVSRLPSRETHAEALPDLKLALVGRPNVGKSSLLNRLCGFDRAIVDSTPGTTRDPVDVQLESSGRNILLIDTAGIRRPTRVEGELEDHSVGRSIGTIRRADVVALVVDASEGITDQ